MFPSGTATSGNGDFGDWSAFNQASPCPSASSGELFSNVAQQPAIELFSSSQPASGQAPTASNSADLFDLMGPSQTTMTSSQSMNFSMMSSNAVGIGLPMSRSQVCSCLYNFLIFCFLLNVLSENDRGVSWKENIIEILEEFLKSLFLCASPLWYIAVLSVAVFLRKKVDVLNFKAESHHPVNVTGFQSERDVSED